MSVNQSLAGPAPDSRHPGRPLRIVAAVPGPALGQFYREALARLGHQVWVAATGRQLVEQCRLLRPDLVLTEIEPPALDGIAAAEEVCRDQPTPFIVVAGSQNAGLVERAFPNPYVLACLLKPAKEVDLGAAIVLARRRFEQMESLRREAAALRQALEDRKLIERAKGLVMRHVGLDEPEAYRRLQKLASDRSRKLTEVAQDIVAASEVFEQLAPPEQAAGSGHGTDRLTGSGEPVRPAPARFHLGRTRRPPSGAGSR